MAKEATQLHTIVAGEEATMFLYGAIGIQTEPDADAVITALTVRKTLDEFVANGATKVHVRINSPGGLVGEAAAIVTALNECLAEVHTYNDGRCYSAAADIWASGVIRHMAKNATMMIHIARGAVAGTPKQMNSYVEMLNKVSDATCKNLAEAMNLTYDEVHQKFYADESDHFLTYDEVKALNLLTVETPEYEAAGMSVQVYEAQKMLIDQLNTQVVQMANEVITITEKTEEAAMNAATLTSAIAEGKITLAEAEAIVATEKAKLPLSNEAVMKLVTDAVAPLKAENAALKVEVETLKTRTFAAAPATPTSDATAESANDPATQTSDLRETLNANLKGRTFSGDDI